MKTQTLRYRLLTLALCGWFLLGPTTLHAQTDPQDRLGQAYMDKKGVLRWKKTKEEVQGFGVNYSVPFAHAYRSAERMSIDPKAAMDRDVYHFSRLGFDLYRLHVWDTEISDTLGNLIENEHLDAFDYLLARLRQKGIRSVITPIAYWGNGWPEPDQPSPGFSQRYGKGDCLTDPACIAAQKNYLTQFANHVNPYTGIAYKDDPYIIAFEVSNEPHHRGDPEVVETFVKGMAEAVRQSGTKKPVYYNGSHAVHFSEQYLASADGGTFQWYPTGLGYQRELSGNLLPNVNDYDMPFHSVYEQNGGGKLVYEFDAADVGRSYIYPAMAREFREAGIQIGTHFAYDPTYLAPFNTEYNTHYMNLAFTPAKAISLMISTEVFHQIPMYSDSGTYPENTAFGDFTVDYKNDLALYNSGEKFYHTNSTEAKPKNESRLRRIAGTGNSPLVEYTGTGAYFLDRLAEGLWRLEIMPDAAWVQNPFGRNSQDKTVGVVKYQERQMSVRLASLGEGFTALPANEGNDYQPEVEGVAFAVKPGVYVLQTKGSNAKWSPYDTFGTRGNHIGDFFAPPSNLEKAWLKHEPAVEATTGQAVEIAVQYVAPEKPEELRLAYRSGWQYENVALQNTEDFRYAGKIPADKVETGFLEYYIIAKMGEGRFVTYPAGLEGQPFDWDFYAREPYRVRVVPSEYPIHLFDAREDVSTLVRPWRRGFREVPLEEKGKVEYQVNLERLFVEDNENLNAEPIHDYSFKHFILDEIDGRRADLTSKSRIVIEGRSLNDGPCKLQVAFVLDDGAAYGAIVELGQELTEYAINVSDLQPVRTVTLPRPYPSFLPYYLEHDIEKPFDINRVESLQFSVGPGLSEQERKQAQRFGLVSVRLE